MKMIKHTKEISGMRCIFLMAWMVVGVHADGAGVPGDTIVADTTASSAKVYSYDDPMKKYKNPWKAAAETFVINAGVNAFDRYVMNEDFAKISFSSIRHNVKHGFVWDNDQFSTNLFAHPYHGNLYFNTARSNGLNFWQSTPYSFCGSLMWEFCGEKEPPAINDLIATTCGGICIGEVMHRVSHLIYNDHDRGFRRFLREFGGALVNPIGELNRLLNGDAWRVRHDYYKYHDFSRIPVALSIAAGTRYLADNGALFRGEANPFLNFDLQYGDAFNEDESKPYDYFTANLTAGLSGNQPLINSLHIVGRLWGTPVSTGTMLKTEFNIFQHFDYYDSQAVKDGSDRVPYRISEAAAFGPGLIYSFPSTGRLSHLEQRIYTNLILLGGSKSDYYNVIDRDYNMGSGYSVKTNTFVEFSDYGRFFFDAEYYRIYTWKGYEGKDLATIDPLYLNAQGDKSNVQLVVIKPTIEINLGQHLRLQMMGAYYGRDTRYKYHDDVKYNTFEVRLGLSYFFVRK